MLKGFDANGERDLVFIPVGINYDRVLEDRTQLLALRPDAPKPGRWRGFVVGAGFVLRSLWLILFGRWHRFGYACVNFGTPISMRAYVRERGLHFPALDESARRAEVSAFAAQIMAAIGGVIPVLPVALVAEVLCRDPAQTLSDLELKAAAHARMRELEASGAHLYIPRQDQDYAFEVGLRMLTLRRMVLEEAGLFRAAPDQLDALRYYANSIAHLQVPAHH
jgi:glycerol-3-phosphate O-acyltransferase